MASNNKNVLIVATTVYHIIVAIQISNTILKSNHIDIILGDETPNMETVTGRLKKAKVFDNVYFVKMDEYNKKYGIYEGYVPIQYALKKYIDIHKMFSVKRKYDILLVPFFHHFHMNLYSYLKRFINTRIRVYLYDEGLAIYSGMGNIYKSLCEEYNTIKVYRKLHYGRMLYEINGIITFNPDLMQWGENYKKIKIPPLDRSNNKLRKLLNFIFAYNGESENASNKKIIFFEEAKSSDGIVINDISIVNHIAKIVGKENILIKLHPRSKTDRFNRIGYETNSNKLIPWEVLYMNHDFSNTLFISTASSSIVHPVILFGEKIKAVFIFKLVHAVLPAELQSHQRFIENVIENKYKECFLIPNSFDELNNIIEKL